MGLAGGLRILQTVSSCRLTLHEIMVSCRHARLPPIIYKQARVPASQQARACSGHAERREHAAQHQNHTELKSVKDAQ